MPEFHCGLVILHRRGTAIRREYLEVRLTRVQRRLHIQSLTQMHADGKVCLRIFGGSRYDCSAASLPISLIFEDVQTEGVVSTALDVDMNLLSHRFESNGGDDFQVIEITAEGHLDQEKNAKVIFNSVRP